MRVLDLIWVRRERKYFCREDWTGGIELISQENFSSNGSSGTLIITGRCSTLSRPASPPRTQGNRFRLTGRSTDQCFEIVWIEVGEFSPDLKAVLVFWISHKVHGHVFDHGHVLRPVEAAQPGEIVVEDDIENPMQPVLDSPMGAGCRREGFGVEHCRREVISSLSRDRAISFDAGLDHADHGQMGEARLVGIAAIREQPIDLVADDMATLLDAAVVAVGRIVLGLQHIWWGG